MVFQNYEMLFQSFINKRVLTFPMIIFLLLLDLLDIFIDLYFCFDPGIRFYFFKPCYPAYRNILHSLNLNVIEIDFDEIEQIKKYKNIDGLIVSSPNNPTGKIFSYDEIEFLYKFCLKNK